MHYRLSDDFRSRESEISTAVNNFHSAGSLLVKGKRNEIRIVSLEDIRLNIKSFRIPIFVNRVIYGYFRKSKAERSFEFALKLLSLGIGTPRPIAFYERRITTGLLDSYYVSEHLETELTFRELVLYPDYPDHENILRQFTRFSYNLHENGIEFKDHSPGNTLIKKVGENAYSFYLVDLNRMDFHKSMSLDMRLKNLSRLTPKKDMTIIISNEYAKLADQPEELVFKKLWQMTCEFQNGFQRKKRLKRKLKFWKKS